MQAERARLALERPDLLCEAAYIHGDWISADTAIEAVNPATGGTLGSVPSLGEAETLRAVAAADAAFASWRGRSASERATLLHRWYALIIENKGSLARLLTAGPGRAGSHYGIRDYLDATLVCSEISAD